MDTRATMRTGEGVYFDGRTSARHVVTVDLERDVIGIRGAEGQLLATWPYHQLKRIFAPQGVLRLGLAGGSSLARLIVRRPELVAAIAERAPNIDQSGAGERRSRLRVVALSLLAAGVLVAIAVFALPVFADRLAPLVPASVERKLGDAVNAEVRQRLDPGAATRADRPFECGEADEEKPGRAALDKMVRKLASAAALQVPIDVKVVRHKDANAVALPGGRIYVFKGLIDKANTADEVAGVLAHEIGHLAHRDGTRAILQGAGLSFLFGMLLGDFVGGGAVVLAAKTVLQTAYSREVESRADLYGAALMEKAGGDPRALATFLSRAFAIEPGSTLLADHPASKERAAAILAAAPARSGPPLLDEADWAALRRICTGS